MQKNEKLMDSATSLDDKQFLSNIAEVTIAYSTKVKAADRKSACSSEQAEKILRQSWDPATIEHVETVKLLLLNRANKVLGMTTLSSGGTAGSVVDVKNIFQYALLANASSIILSHNHPSGNRKPSELDIRITQKVKKAGGLLDITLLDNLILTPYDGYYSMADEGEL